MNTGHWTYNAELVQPHEDMMGFVYEIVHIPSGRRYIGKKQCKTIVKLKPLKGKKRRRHVEKPMKWEFYTSSSKEINEIIENDGGTHNFTFEILRICDSKWEMGYFEIKEQIDRNALIDPLYFNGIINVRVSKAPQAYLDKLEATTGNRYRAI